MLPDRSTLRRICLLCLLVGAFSFGFSATSRADIVVRGANGKKTADLNNWCAAHIAPRFHSGMNVVVSQLTDSEMTAYLNNGQPIQNGSNLAEKDDSNDDIDGIFEDNPPRITLRLLDNGEPDMLTFAHEYGHFVWFHLLSKADRSRYNALYKHQRGIHRLVTAYAATDVQEGFAEAFSFYVNDPSILLNRDSASFGFLSNWQNPAGHRA